MGRRARSARHRRREPSSLSTAPRRRPASAALRVRRARSLREVAMSAAYDSVSFHSAAAIVAPLEAPAAPESGIKTVLVARPLSATERAREFRAVYDAHVAFVWRNLRRLGVMDRDVEDKCQEVFVVA